MKILLIIFLGLFSQISSADDFATSCYSATGYGIETTISNEYFGYVRTLNSVKSRRLIEGEFIRPLPQISSVSKITDPSQERCGSEKQSYLRNFDVNIVDSSVPLKGTLSFLCVEYYVCD